MNDEEYNRNSDKFYKKSTDRLQRTIEKIFEGINHRNSRRALFKRDDCGHLRGDYGIIENGQKVGGGLHALMQGLSLALPMY